MADVREVFPILADVSGVGVDVSQMQEGFSPSGKNGILVFGFKDATGNVILPTLTADGKVPVSTQSPGTKKHARGEDLAGDKDNLVTVATLALTQSKSYSDLNLVCSSRRDALFQVIWNNNGVETVLLDAIVGAGKYTEFAQMNDLVFVSGATGTQELLVKGINFDKASAMRATIDILEAV